MKLPKSYYNYISFIGTIIAGMSLGMMVLFSILGYLYEETSSYLGLFVFIIHSRIFNYRIDNYSYWNDDRSQKKENT